MKTYEELFDKNGKYITDESYTEIIKLHEMLEKAKIPHTFKKFMDGYQVCYPEHYRTGKCVCDALEHCGSYYNEDNLLEIKGLLNDSERLISFDGVIGGLTAQNVFDRIKTHYEKETL